MKTSTAIIALVIIILLGGGAWWFMNQNTSTPSDNQGATPVGQTTTNTLPVDTTPTAPMSAEVHFTSTGFSPSSVTVGKGGTVTFVNDTTQKMWIGSDEHPTHTDYDNTSRTTHCAAGYTGAKPFDQCASGNTYSFTFDKTGSFMFHNHAAAQFEGTVVVQ